MQKQGIGKLVIRRLATNPICGGKKNTDMFFLTSARIQFRWFFQSASYFRSSVRLYEGECFCYQQQPEIIVGGDGR